MVQFFTLASSSSGNSYFFGDENCSILIDCGISCKSICSILSSKSINPDKLDAIIITHEHSDHTKGLKIFLKKYKIPVYGSAEVIHYLRDNGLVPEDTLLKQFEDNFFQINKMTISAFRTSHDSVGSRGYIIEYLNNKVSICTDTGILSEENINKICGSNLVLLESNYEKTLLEAGPYPYNLKRRIESNLGHLSNMDCAKVLPVFVRNGTKYIFLAHLSPVNNYPELALNSALSELSYAGFRKDIDYYIFVASKDSPSESIVLSGDNNEIN